MARAPGPPKGPMAAAAHSEKNLETEKKLKTEMKLNSEKNLNSVKGEIGDMLHTVCDLLHPIGRAARRGPRSDWHAPPRAPEEEPHRIAAESPQSRASRREHRRMDRPRLQRSCRQPP